MNEYEEGRSQADETAPQPEDRPRRLLRSGEDRVLAGVAGGLGRYFDVDPLIFRIGFGISVFFGGLGAIAYLLLALFVPSDGTTARGEGGDRSRWLTAGLAVVVAVIAFSTLGSFFFWDGDWDWGPGWGLGWLITVAAIATVIYIAVRDRDEPLRGRRVVALAAIVLGVTCALACLAVVAAFATATGNGIVIASLVAAAGALLVVAAFRGGARWLIAPALALAIPVGLVSAADVSFGGGIGERDYRPASIAAIPDDGYELGVGRLTVDLRDLDWRNDDVVDLDVDLGVGEAVVAVPEDVCVAGDLDASVGVINVAGDESDGIEVDSDDFSGATATPRLDLDASVDLGALRVVNDDNAVIEDDGKRWDDDGAGSRIALERACSRP
jgi:phage shock protein PspC (stress-responsive transcriptional regulator)